MKKAFLVTYSVTTRVVIEDSENEELTELRAFKAGIPQAIANLREDGVLDHSDTLEEDKECPFGSLPKDTES